MTGTSEANPFVGPPGGSPFAVSSAPTPFVVTPGSSPFVVRLSNHSNGRGPFDKLRVAGAVGAPFVLREIEGRTGPGSPFVVRLSNQANGGRKGNT